MESSIPNKYISQIEALKHQLSIVDAQFLSTHLVGKNNHRWITYRDPDRNWYANDFFPILDDVATQLIGQNAINQFYLLTGSDYPDKYINSLLSNFKVSIRFEWDESRDIPFLESLLQEWKAKILTLYSKEDHIKFFTWDMLLGEKSQSVRVNTYKEIIKVLGLEDGFTFDNFSVDGMSFTVIDYRENIVRLNSINGLFSHFSRYGYHKPVLPNAKVVDIPFTIYWTPLHDMTIEEIGPGVFDNLTETEIIKLPSTLKRIDWSFWKCSKLQSIELKVISPYTPKTFQSIDGVLYSSDGKILYAYPNCHGEVYSIPEGVEIVHKFAFKSCGNLKELCIPSSIRRIGTNAFYRCSSLERIICDMPQQQFVFEGFQGNYQPFSPKWFFYKDVETEDKTKIQE